MSVAAGIDPKKIRRISTPETTSPSRLSEYTRWAERMALQVERRWQAMPTEKREILTAFAYQMSQSPKGFVGHWSRFMGRARLAYILLKGEEEVLREFLNAAGHLVSAVVDAIERENPDYDRAIKHAVEEALEQPGKQRMTTKEAGEWTGEIFDRAVK